MHFTSDEFHNNWWVVDHEISNLAPNCLKIKLLVVGFYVEYNEIKIKSGLNYKIV